MRESRTSGSLEGRILQKVRLLDPGTKLGWRAVFAMTELFSAAAPGVAEKLGYEYIDTIDLDLNIPWLKWFKLYELLL